jgi:hypothetical protein
LKRQEEVLPMAKLEQRRYKALGTDIAMVSLLYPLFYGKRLGERKEIYSDLGGIGNRKGENYIRL